MNVIMLIRHALSIAILPGVVTIFVPLWIARRYGVPPFSASPGAIVLVAAGLVVLAIGLLLFFSSLRRFAVEGRGTLAPWDPPRSLVVRGPYRYVRNPMISGVILLLAGEGMILRSGPHLIWALAFLGLNLVYIPLFEEPILRLRFGEAYREYCRNVPGILPRLRPWEPAAHEDRA